LEDLLAKTGPLWSFGEALGKKTAPFEQVKGAGSGNSWFLSLLGESRNKGDGGIRASIR
jgi:hypothetical protein